ncbi:hypothetical protein EDC01DRAFT_414026 [Geopyxis carbonaria]|nr:hypothetical protein EDC01DRAFT_414026 [Geopyxis carbonaria]
MANAGEHSDSIGDLIRPRSTPPIMSQKLRRQDATPRPKIRFSVDAGLPDLSGAAEPLSRSPVMGDGDHIYTSGLRRIRQQATSYGSQGFVIPNASPTGSGVSTRVNSLSFAPSSPTLGSCEDLARFPSESLHSFSFAHQSEDLIHSRQNILKRSIEFMRDKLGWGTRSPLIASAQAKAEGYEDVEGMMELLRRADLVSKEKTPMLTGPVTGPAGIEGNPFDKSFSNMERPISDVERLSSSPVFDSTSRDTSRSATNDSESTSHSSPPPTRRASLKRTYTDTSSLAMQSKLYDAMSQPYLESDEPRIRASAIGPRAAIRKSSVHGHTNRHSPTSQAIFTTESHSPWTILAANDLACLVFGVTKAEVRKIGIMEVVREERREWLANKLNSGENTSTSYPYPHSHHGSPHTTGSMFQGTGRRVKSDAYYTGSPMPKGDTNLHHRHNQSRGVILCGDVVPIQKRNGNIGAASLWVKEKRGGLIWVLEEISEDVAFLYSSPGDDMVERVHHTGGDLNNIFGELDNPIQGSELTSLIPTLPRKIGGKVDFEQTALIHQFTVKAQGGVRIPCGVEPMAHERGLRISSFPHIAGIIVISAATLQISSTNAVFSAALLGQLNPVGLSITDLIPNFDRILKYLTEEEHIHLIDGMVVPEHSFRKANAILSLRDGKDNGISAFSRAGGLIARHRDGAEIFVDLQMRVVMSESKNENAILDDGEDYLPDKAPEIVYAVWITYSRHLHVASATTDPMSSQARRPVTPPKRPSPGQPSTPIEPSIEQSAKSDHTISLLTKQLEDIQNSHTPPSSDDDEALVMALRPIKPLLPRNATAPPTVPTKKTIQDFNILEDMGEGAYGQVKLARYKKNSAKRVVLKYVTKRRILVDTWTRDRRLGTVPLEIHVLDYLRRDGLKHPNIIEMTDFFEDDINYYIEMVPHGLPGMDLFDYIELKVNMDEDECRSIFVQVARALHHLHVNCGVVHRDIKDENVVLDGEGNIKLIDFGSAAYIKNGPFDVFVGTIDYAAPEVLQGKSYKGKEQDVWALGVLLYTICYKENPFYNIDEIMDRELRIPFIMSEISLDLIKMMLDRDVERRPNIEQVLAHPWFEELPSPTEALLAESPIQASVKAFE